MMTPLTESEMDDAIKRSKVLWREDDAKPPDAERYHEAWHRLFGVPISDEYLQVHSAYDGGDWAMGLFPNGRIIVHSCEGSEIREIVS